MIKLLWIACSIPAFIYTLKFCIKDEIETFGAIDSGLLFFFILLSIVAFLLGPIAILGYIGYTILEDITQSINERYKNEH